MKGKTMEVQFELAVEELKSATNPAEKQLLLQKYGLIDPKLTDEEKALIVLESVFGRTA